MALGVAGPAGAGQASGSQVEFITQLPQRPDQLAFDARVHPGIILMVGKEPTGNRMATPFCTGIRNLQMIWRQSGSDPACATLWTGSWVKVLEKTRAYTVDDPTQPIEPYTNDAHLVIKVQVVTVTDAAGKDAAGLAGRVGYVVADDLDWPPARP